MYKEEGRHLYDVHAYNNSQTKLTISLGSFMGKAELLGKPSIIAYIYSRAIDSTVYTLSTIICWETYPCFLIIYQLLTKSQEHVVLR